MSFFSSLSALLATKTGGAVAAGLVVATGTAGIATATDVLDDGFEPTVLNIQEDEGDDDGVAGDDIGGISGDDAAEGEEGPAEEGLENRSETANRVHEVISERDSFESGRDFGRAVSSAARGDDDSEEGDEPGTQGRERAEQARSQDTEDESTGDDGELDGTNDDEDGEPAAASEKGRSKAAERSGAERP